MKKRHLGPNHLLREERERRGWSLRDVADRIHLPDSSTLGRWERGVTFPQPHYRQALCEVFGKPPMELGLVPSQSPTRVRAPQQSDPAPVADVASLTAPESGTLPALSASGIALYDVPAAVTSFVGRQRDVEEVCTLLSRDDVRLVTLLGPGGIGKTRLAMQVATQLRGHFISGICFIALSSVTDPDLVLPLLAQALHIEQGSALSLLSQVKHLLQDRHFLVIFDSFEQVKAAAPLFDDLLTACAGLKILVTSRVVLHLQAEHEFVVRPLALPALDNLPPLDQLQQYSALALYVQRARAHVSTFRITEQNARALVALCTRLDGLPLAIELAAARSKMLTPQQVLDLLTTQHIQALRSPVSTLPERQKTLSNMVQWSYDLLRSDEQWLFRHLAVFAGPWSLDVASDLLRPLTLQSVPDGISTLLDHSLIQQYDGDNGEEEDRSRFSLLETMREFGRECLRVCNELQSSQREHALYYLALVERAAPELKGSGQTRWLQRLEQEKENLRAAQQWLVEQHETVLALRFAEACGKFYGLRGYWTEEWYWLRAVLVLPLADGEQTALVTRARVLRRAGHLAYRLRYLDDARSWQEESVGLSRELNDQLNLAGALSGLAWTLYRQKEDRQRVDQLLQQSLEAARLSGDRWCLANTLESAGRFEHRLGRNARARELLDESIQLSRGIQDRESLARILTTAVAIELAEQNITRATLLTDESWHLAQELGTRPLLALVLDCRIDIALARQDYAQARALCRERMNMALELGDRSTESYKHLQLGQIELAEDNIKGARIFALNALRSFQAQNDQSNLAAAQELLRAIEQAASQHDNVG